MMRVTDQLKAERMLWAMFPRQYAFVTEGSGVWVAVMVPGGQWGPPYRTVVVAEAETASGLVSALMEA